MWWYCTLDDATVAIMAVRELHVSGRLLLIEQPESSTGCAYDCGRLFLAERQEAQQGVCVTMTACYSST